MTERSHDIHYDMNKLQKKRKVHHRTEPICHTLCKLTNSHMYL